MRLILPLLVLFSLMATGCASSIDVVDTASDDSAGGVVADDSGPIEIAPPLDDTVETYPPETVQPSEEQPEEASPPTTEAISEIDPLWSSDFPEIVDALRAAEARWSETTPRRYLISWSLSCFCPPTVYTDEIADGGVVSHEADNTDTWIETTGVTMEDLISQVELALLDNPAFMSAEFDPETGALISYYVDPYAEMADEEYGVTVHSVTVLND